MGKKSLTKSTTKKKATAKKKSTKKKTVKTAAKKAALKKAVAKKTAVKKPVKKAKPRKPPLKSLLKRQFDAWKPESMFVPEKDKAVDANYTAPPFIDASNKKTAKKVSTLLAKKFDLTPATPKKATKKKTKKEAAKKAPDKKVAKKTKEVKAPVKKAKTKPKTPKAAPKKKVSVPELLAMKFDVWAPDAPFVPESVDTGNFAAPPAIDETDPQIKARVKGLLAKTFDLTAPTEPGPIKEEITETMAEEPSVEVIDEAPPEATVVETIEKAPTEEPVTEAAEETPTEKAVAEVVEEMTAAKPEPTKVDAPTMMSPPPEPPPLHEDEPIIGGFAKKLIVVLGSIFVILLFASMGNRQEYYVIKTDTALEIQRGKFSPMGKSTLVALPGAKAPADQMDVYSKEEALKIAFTYFIEKANAFTVKKDLDDYKAVKSYLEEADDYAPTAQDRKNIYQRLNMIDFATLIFQADLAVKKKTEKGYAAALNYLKDAISIDVAETQIKAAEKKIKTIEKLRKTLPNNQKVSESPKVKIKKK